MSKGLSEEAVAEGRRLVVLQKTPTDLERFTCFRCTGALLRAEATSEQKAQWSDLASLGRTRTLCPLAWDLYNTDGDCLAEK